MMVPRKAILTDVLVIKNFAGRRFSGSANCLPQGPPEIDLLSVFSNIPLNVLGQGFFIGTLFAMEFPDHLVDTFSVDGLTLSVQEAQLSVNVAFDVF